MEDHKKSDSSSTPSDYVTLAHLKERWLKEKEKEQREKEQREKEQREKQEEEKRQARRRLEEEKRQARRCHEEEKREARRCLEEEKRQARKCLEEEKRQAHRCLEEEKRVRLGLNRGGGRRIGSGNRKMVYVCRSEVEEREVATVAEVERIDERKKLNGKARKGKFREESSDATVGKIDPKVSICVDKDKEVKELGEETCEGTELITANNRPKNTILFPVPVKKGEERAIGGKPKRAVVEVESKFENVSVDEGGLDVKAWKMQNKARFREESSNSTVGTIELEVRICVDEDKEVREELGEETGEGTLLISSNNGLKNTMPVPATKKKGEEKAIGRKPERDWVEVERKFENLSVNGGDKGGNQRVLSVINGDRRGYRSHRRFSYNKIRRPADRRMVWIQKGESSSGGNAAEGCSACFQKS